MLFYSTNKQSSPVSFSQAVLTGLAEDGGLFMPETIPSLSRSFFQEIDKMPWPEIAFQASQAFLEEEIPLPELRRMITEVVNFPVPLHELSPQTHILELFHGPTLAFKDFGARFMAQVLSFLAQKREQKTVILVATSGDTGSAVAQGFLNVPSIEVILLYPQGKVSRIQEQQLTTIGENITALEIKGTFDDCQSLVKKAFTDIDLKRKMQLTSANSINIARLIPQSFYYFFAYASLSDKNTPVVFSVPSGNFGNLTAGLIAQKMGLPISHFIAATNRNSVVVEYLQGQEFTPRTSEKTLSNAMDVGNPSNFTRMLELFGHSRSQMQEKINGASFSDEETLAEIQEIHQKHNYILDPHTAVASLAWKKYQKEIFPDHQGVVLSTAHPAKFCETVQQALGQEPEIPERLQKCLEREKKTTVLSKEFAEFKEFCLGR